MGLKKIFRNLKYKLSKYDPPKIKSVDETIDDLIKKKVSICRFGDGELGLITGQDTIFQKTSEKLSKRLIEILSSKNDKILIAIPRILFFETENLVPLVENFWRSHGPKFKYILGKYIDSKHQYYSAEISIAYSMYQDYPLENYFDHLQKIWHNQDLAIICGRTVFDGIENNIFSNAKSVEYIYGESQNAFENYDDLFLRSKKINKNKIIIIILGPTAKILAYDLALQGYQALDLGHIAKSYDWYIKNKNTQNISSAVEFFNPD